MTTTTHRFSPGTRVWVDGQLGTVCCDALPTGMGEPRVMVSIPGVGVMPLLVERLRIPQHIVWSVGYRYDSGDVPQQAVVSIAADTPEQAAQQAQTDLGGVLPGFALTGQVDLQPPTLLAY